MNAAGGAASIFHLVQQVFNSILRARGFRDDFDVYQIQLQVHLSRCAAIINDANRRPEIANRSPEATIFETLSAIQETLRKAQREAAQIRAELMAAGGDLEAWCTSAPLSLKTMRLRTTEYLDKRRTQAAKRVEALKWAFYKKENCDKFISDISALLLHLERQVNAVPRNASFLLIASPLHLHEAAHDSTR